MSSNYIAAGKDLKSPIPIITHRVHAGWPPSHKVAKYHGFEWLYATTEGAHGLPLRKGWSETGFRSQ